MEEQKQPLFRKLWERRVPHVFASYLLGAWAFIQFLDWLVNRYGLASGLIETFIVFALLVLPSVMMFTWYHGKPGKDEWRKIEKVFIPINVVAAIIVAIIVFPGGSMATETQTVTVTTEEGDTLIREVPELQYQQRYAIFPFTLEDTDEKWLQHAIPTLLELKLEQDMRVNAVRSLSFLDDLHGYGYRDVNERKIPANIFRTISGDSYCNYHILGQISASADGYELSYQLFDTATGKEKFSGISKGSLYEITDDVHDQIRASTLLKDYLSADDTYVNLPAESLISPVPEAFRLFVEGSLALVQNVNSQTGLASLKESIVLDDKCAECFTAYGKYGMTRYGVNFKQQYLETAVKLSDALTERQQFEIKYQYYFPNEIKKAEALCEMWRKLYPMDVKPYDHIIQLYELTKQYNAAMEMGKLALEQGHGGKMYLKLSNLATAMGKMEDSRKFLEAFKTQYPKKAMTAREVGMSYMFDDKREEAISFFEDRILLEPANPDHYTNLGTVYMLMGNFEKQRQILNDGLELARDPRDSIAIMSMLEYSFQSVGKVGKAMEVWREKRQIEKRVLPPVSYAFGDILPVVVSRYKEIGREDLAVAGAQRFIDAFSSDQYNYGCIAYTNLYIGLEDGEMLDRTLDTCSSFLLAADGPQTVSLANGIADMSKGNYQEAISNLKQFCKISGIPEFRIAGYLGRAYLLAGRLKDAEQLLKQAIQYEAAHPEFDFLLARVYKAQGNEKEAITLGKQALDIWKEADADFIPKKELQRFLDEIVI